MNFENKTYKNVKKSFETTHFKIMKPVGYAEIDEKKDLVIRNKGDFNNAYENLHYYIKKVKAGKTDKHGEEVEADIITFDKKSFVKEWYQDDTMRTYDCIDFLPQQKAPDNVYNIFNGYEAEKTKPSEKPIDIENSLMMKHIRNLCNNEENVFSYIMNFLARKVQKPYLLTRTALLIKGPQGCGKDTLFEWFGNKILGSEYFYSGSFNEIFAKFNKSCIDKKIIVVISETGGKDTFENEDIIKFAITRPRNAIEEKGMPKYETTNNIGYVFLTNSESPLNIRFDDRRFLGIECTTKIANNHEYFTNLYKEIEDNKFNRAFFEYFMKMKVPDDYDFINERPKTSFYAECQQRNIPIIAKFFENELMINAGKEEVVYFRMFEHVSSYLKSNGYSFGYTETKLGNDLKKYKGITKKHTKKGAKYTINMKDLKEDLVEKKFIENFNFEDVEFVEDDKMEETNDD